MTLLTEVAVPMLSAVLAVCLTIWFQARAAYLDRLEQALVDLYTKASLLLHEVARTKGGVKPGRALEDAVRDVVAQLLLVEGLAGRKGLGVWLTVRFRKGLSSTASSLMRKLTENGDRQLASSPKFVGIDSLSRAICAMCLKWIHSRRDFSGKKDLADVLIKSVA